jgi:3-oxoacyl-[acyl-carrier-protein] synthase II
MAEHKDKAGRPVVAITGMGLITSLGTGKEDNWKKLVAGESGIRTISRFPIDGLRTTIAGTVEEGYEPNIAPSRHTERIAKKVGEEAIEESGIGAIGNFPGPMFLAMAPIELEWPHRFDLANATGSNDNVTYADLVRVSSQERFAPYYEMAKYGIVGENLADHFGTQGSPISLTTACASGATAIQLGVEAIRRGECQAALAIGADTSVTPESVVRFSLLSALSTQNANPSEASNPFSKYRDGFVLAGGAAALVLENLDHAKARGAKILAIIPGTGEKSDLVQQIHDRAYAHGCRRRGSRRHHHDNPASAHSADDQSQGPRPRHFARCGAECRARRQDQDGDLKLVRFWRAECVPGDRGRAGLTLNKV